MGCEGCSNGSAGGSGATRGGCVSCQSRFAVFDWLSNMELPQGQEKFDGVEVRFKNGRKEFFRDTRELFLKIGDVVATEASSGHDIGVVSLTGELVRVQMRKKNVDPYANIPKVYRRASQRDIDVWQEARKREHDIMLRARKIAKAMGLQMKISDVEFQGDATKATFYYTADSRIDFRELIKKFAREFRTRIEMRQIGMRQEAARLGGIGVCGRELCCSSWMKDFRSVSTKAARYQQLSLNPQKLAGQCGKLKCCLNFELDSYLDALKDFPRKETKLNTKKGKATCQKMDIFRGRMWYAYVKDSMNWHPLTTEQVKEIIAADKAGKPVDSLEQFSYLIADKKDHKKTYENVVGQDSLTRFDQPKKNRRKKRKKRKRKQRRKND
ncbi:MAG TPA: regulatory iron-sulfur-containing complex subunit RicT [Flavobacteriaceae bacterium]|nr:regulatory iron-sulfur-containing complex subunit RicT [Flavobacteriaceae bacterium]